MADKPLQGSSESVFELFLDEEVESEPKAVSKEYKENFDEYKEETEPAFLFKGAYYAANDYYQQNDSDEGYTANEYNNNNIEYRNEYSDNKSTEYDAPVKAQSKPKISDRIKVFEQLANTKSSPSNNKYHNDDHDKLNEDKKPDLSELVRQESSSSLYLTDEEAIQTDISDQELDDSKADTVPLNTRDWNNGFQNLLSLPKQSTFEKLERAKQIQLFVRDFTSEVSRIGKVIINEVGKAYTHKTYRPVNVGGIAGGEKYLVNNIFFKFALDIYHLYGGTEFAMKAANMELLGLDAYLDAQQVVHGLRIPLMCLLDYKGYRLAATTVLPIDKDTLIYGSADGGKTVMMSNPQVNQSMEEAAKYLNIKPHKVTDKLITIHSPIDIEVHAARDNNIYVLDSARVWPPEHPLSLLPALLLPAKGDKIEKFDLEMPKISHLLGESVEKASSVLSEGVVYFSSQTELENEPLNEYASIIAGFPIKGKAIFIYSFQGRFLYNQLRPEFVKKYSKPLSSDAFSGFGKHDAQVNNAEIIEATKYLRDHVLRIFSEKLLSAELVPSSGSALVVLMHQHGINVRYLGLLLNYCAENSRLAALIMTEMVSRTLKNFMKRKLRMMKTREDYHCQKIIVKYLNIALGNSPHTELFWKKLIYLLMEMKFGQYLTSKIDQKLNHPLRGYISTVPLLSALLRHIGVKLTKEVHSQIISDKLFLDKNQPFKIDDIMQIDTVLKGLHFGSQKEFNELIDQHVKFTLKDFPNQNSIDYVENIKKEKHKLVQQYYGNTHYECALTVTDLASFYVNENRLDEAKALLILANDLLYLIREVPIEAFLSLMLSFGLVEEKLGNAKKASDYFFIGFGLLERVFSPTGRNLSPLMIHILIAKQTHHPMLFFFLNYCLKYMKDSTNLSKLKQIAGAYFNMWKVLNFPGDADARSKIFGSDYPYAMSLVWEEHVASNSGLNMNPNVPKQLLHVELGDKPLSDPVTQQWFQKVMLQDYLSGVTIFVDMEAEELLKLKYLVSTVTVPDRVTIGQDVVVTWEVESTQYTKLRLLSTPEGAYLSETSALVEVQTWPLTAKTGELTIPAQYVSRPGQYYVDLRETAFGGEYRVFGFVVLAPEAEPDNFSIEPKNLKLAVETNLMGKTIRGTCFTTSGFILTDNDVPLWLRTKDSHDITPVLKGKEFVCIRSSNVQVVRRNYQIVEKFVHFGLTKSHQLYTWGYSQNYANGHATEETINVPRAVSSLTGVTVFDACAGTDFLAVLTNTGNILVCGTLPWEDNNVVKSFTPLELPKKERVIAMCASSDGLCLLTEFGYALYYGFTYEDTKNPNSVKGIKITFKNEKIVEVSAGSYHHLFVSESGKLAGLGQNNQGALGYGHGEEMKYLTEHTELTPSNQCPGVKYVRVFGHKHQSVALDDRGRLFFWGSSHFLPRSPPALAKYPIKSVFFAITTILASTHEAAPHKLQLEPRLENPHVPEVNNNNNANIKEVLYQARDLLFTEYFGGSVKEFLNKCGLTEEHATKAELLLAGAGLVLNDMPLLTASNLRQLLDDELIVLKMAKRLTEYYIKTLSSINNE